MCHLKLLCSNNMVKTSVYWDLFFILQMIFLKETAFVPFITADDRDLETRQRPSTLSPPSPCWFHQWSTARMWPAKTSRNGGSEARAIRFRAQNTLPNKKLSLFILDRLQKGKLNLVLLPSSSMRLTFVCDDGYPEQLALLSNDFEFSEVMIEEISADNSRRSFLIRISESKVFYYWCAEKSKED
ncbi:putative calcium-binding protein CML27 [Zea mays]|uniref:Putative calcium-binding protein CML27 n=1 Tax=Zea mays TaxID=4577 RepID=A0A1D6L4V2_MAIZE|nr:putative calcium-binding protein CML27 [Zea mays]